jgi:hypothetical protein
MDPLIIPIVAFLIPIIIVPTAMGIKHARFLREIEHVERMKAMELGLAPADEHSWTPAGIAGSIGAGVPIAVMFIAFIAAPRVGPAEAIWRAAGMIGVAGVICGTVLASMQMSKVGQASTAPTVEKPAYDPDQFDVVSSRG